MSPPRVGRTQDCGPREAATRLAQALKMYEAAELVAGEDEIDESLSTAAALAVLAGIAASDAACCAALGRRSRSADHHDAEALLRSIEPDGERAASRLRRVLAEKDAAHYGLTHVSGQTLLGLMRNSQALIEFARSVVSR